MKHGTAHARNNFHIPQAKQSHQVKVTSRNGSLKNQPYWMGMTTLSHHLYILCYFANCTPQNSTCS